MSFDQKQTERAPEGITGTTVTKTDLSSTTEIQEPHRQKLKPDAHGNQRDLYLTVISPLVATGT